MFPLAPEPPLASPFSLRGAFRHAVDLTVAFTTLESYTVDDVWPPRRRTAAAPTDPRAAGPLDLRAATASALDAPLATAPRRPARQARLGTLEAVTTRRPGTARTLKQHRTAPLAPTSVRASAAATPAARASAKRRSAAASQPSATT